MGSRVARVEKIVLDTGWRLYFVILLAALGAFSQAPNGQPPPLELKWSEDKTGRFPVIVAQLRNTTARNVYGYVIRADFFDESGKLIVTSVRRGLRVRDIPGGHAYDAGKTWTAGRISIPKHDSGRVPTYQLSLDYVLFEDSSDWGPDTLKRAREVRADIAGVQAGKASLQKTLEKEGLSGVEKELKAVAPPPKKQR